MGAYTNALLFFICKRCFTYVDDMLTFSVLHLRYWISELARWGWSQEVFDRWIISLLRDHSFFYSNRLSRPSFPPICDNYLKLFFYSFNYISLCGGGLFKGLEILHKKSHDCHIFLRLYIDLFMLLDLISKVKRLSWILFLTVAHCIEIHMIKSMKMGRNDLSSGDNLTYRDELLKCFSVQSML